MWMWPGAIRVLWFVVMSVCLFVLSFVCLFVSGMVYYVRSVWCGRERFEWSKWCVFYELPSFSIISIQFFFTNVCWFIIVHMYLYVYYHLNTIQNRWGRTGISCHQRSFECLLAYITPGVIQDSYFSKSFDTYDRTPWCECGPGQYVCCDLLCLFACLFVCLFVCERDGGLCTERVVEGITTKAAGCGYAITNGVKSVMGVTKM